MTLHLRVGPGKPPRNFAEGFHYLDPVGAPNLKLAVGIAMLECKPLDKKLLDRMKGRVGIWLVAAQQTDIGGKVWDNHAPLHVMWIFDHALPRSATVIAPRALYTSELGGYSWARSVAGDEFDHVDFQDAIDQLPRFLREVSALYQVDPQRVIVMGFSQGAALSYAFSLAHPELLRGVIALAGFLPNRSSAPLRDASQLSYLIIHGTHDEAVPIVRAREARSALESSGASVEYHEHRVGHKVSAQGMKEIARWIKEILA